MDYANVWLGEQALNDVFEQTDVAVHVFHDVMSQIRVVFPVKLQQPIFTP